MKELELNEIETVEGGNKWDMVCGAMVVGTALVFAFAGPIGLLAAAYTAPICVAGATTAG